MKPSALPFAALLLCAAAPAALAQAPAAPATATEGVLVYPPEFFTEARPSTAADMIARLPGFTFKPGEQARGFAGTAGNVLIDGQRPASKEGLSDLLARIPAAQVARVELIRGGAPGVDMQGETVVANVVRRRLTSFQRVLTPSTALISDGRALFGLSFEMNRQEGERAWDVALGAFGGSDDGVGPGLRTRVDVTGRLIEQALVDAQGGGPGYELKGGYRSPLAGGRLRLNATTRASSFTSLFSLRGGPTPEDTETLSEGVRGEFGVNWDRSLGPRTDLLTVALQRLVRSESVSTSLRGPSRSVFTSASLSGESIARASVRFQQSEALSLEWGGEGAFNFLDSQSGLSADGAPVVLPTADVRVEERRGEAFAQAVWRPADTLSLEAGSRFEVSTIQQVGDAELERSFFYPKPRLLLTWSPTADHQLRLRVQREVGQLSFGDFATTAVLQDDLIRAGNPELEPEKAWVYEAAYERRFWDKGAVVATVRHREITDAVDLVPVVGPGFAFDAPGNIGDGTSDELQLVLTVPLDRLGVANGLLKGEGVWRISEVSDPATGQTRRISNQQPYGAFVSFTHDLARLRSTWGFESQLGFKRQDFRLAEVRMVQSTPNLSFFAEYKPSPKLAIRAQLRNVTQFETRLYRTVYAGPRDDAPVLFREQRALTTNILFLLRVRRVLG